MDILSLARGYGYEPEKAGRKAVHMKHSGGLYIFPENNRFFQGTGPDDGVKMCIRDRNWKTGSRN